MTASTEWSQVESSMQSMEPSSSDGLFDGEILGDELMDIYNDAVVGAGNDEDGVMNGISSNGAVDDGFGAFRPSTSFSNLSIMMQDTNNETTDVAVAPTQQPPSDLTTSGNAARVVSSTSLDPGLVISPAPAVANDHFITTADGTKRKLVSTNITAPSPKRTTPVGGLQSKPQNSTAKVAMSNKTISKKNTQNTLTSNRTSAASLPTVTLLPKVKTEFAPIAAANAVVTPHTMPIIKQDPNAPVSVVSSAAQAQTATKVASQTKGPQNTTSSAPTAASNPPTEADFKSVAQAAVNNLIMNAGAKKTTKTASAKTAKGSSNSSQASTSSSTNSQTTAISTTIKVDTSTEHVKALTGSNWVAVCGGAGIIGDSSSNQNNCEKNRARRSNLTPDERARQNRDRNREHARNTRLRKKAYVEELKATLSALVSQRDAAELEKSHASQRELEQREVRFRVLEEFLKLRGRNEPNCARWAAILDNKFTLTLPVASYREMVHSNNANHANVTHEQVLTGVAEVMNDSNLCAAFLQSLGKPGNTESITLNYDCDRNNFFMDNCVAVLDLTATTHGASEQGIELVVKGHIKARFCPASNKLLSVVMSFDTGTIISQVDLIQKVKESSEAEAAAAAARVAANEADALLDSLQMPHFEPPSAVAPSSMPATTNVVPPCNTASSREENALISSDDENHNNSKEEAGEEQMLF